MTSDIPLAGNQRARAKPRRAASSIIRNNKARDQILVAAEALFAEQGFDATSLRDITERANVNVAAVNYYFASKYQLVQEVLGNRLAPYIAQRALSLSSYLDSLDGAFPSVEKIAEAMIRPMVQYSRDENGGRLLIRLLLQVRAQPTNESIQMFEARVDPIAHRFVAAFQDAAPHLDRATVYWRYNFSLGAVMQVLADADPATNRLKRLSGDLCDTEDNEAIIRELVSFVSNGIAARC